MLSGKRKRDLEDCFFHNDDPPEDMDFEEQEYWENLSARYQDAYLSILKKNIQEDARSHGH